MSNDAFDSLFREYYPAMMLYACRVCPSEEMAKDMVQDVFVRLLDKQKKTGELQDNKSYLFRMLHNRIIDELRSQKVRQADNLTHDVAEDSFENTLFEIELYQRLYAEIERLPLKTSSVLKLRMAGKNDHEIAETLGMKLETVRSHRKYALKLLRKKFTDKQLSIFF